MISEKFNRLISTNQTNKLKQSQQFGNHLRRPVTVTRWRHSWRTTCRTKWSRRGRTRHTSWRIFAGFSCLGHFVVLISIKKCHSTSVYCVDSHCNIDITKGTKLIYCRFAKRKVGNVIFLRRFAIFIFRSFQLSSIAPNLARSVCIPVGTLTFSMSLLRYAFMANIYLLNGMSDFGDLSFILFIYMSIHKEKR